MITYILYNLILFIIIEKYFENWKQLLNFILFLINISFYIIRYRNYIYYSIFVLFSSMICVTYFIINFQFSKKNVERYMIYFFLLLSVLTFIAVTLNKYYIYETTSNEARHGDQGDEGNIGHDGNQAKILNSLDLCVNQMMVSGNTEVKDYIKNKPDIQHRLRDENPDDLLFKNLFMKRKFKDICKSSKYNNLKSSIGEYNALNKLKEVSNKWARIILNYEQGFNFLNNYFYIDKTWDKLLSRNKALNENMSPFKIIKTDNIWNW